jgi:MFS family permease
MKQYWILFRRRDFGLLTAADAISLLGDQVGWMALLWFVMTTTQHSYNMGELALAFGLPGVVLGPMVGNLLDRWPRKTVLLGALLVLGVIFAAIPLLYHTHHLGIATLLGLVVVAGCLTSFTTIGWMVMLPSVVAREELAAANSVSETLWQTASLIGPPIGGALIASAGAPAAVFLDAVSFWLAALCLLPLKEPKVHPSAQSKDQSKVRLDDRCDPERKAKVPSSAWVSFWRDTSSGLRYLYAAKAVWWITLGALFLNMAYGFVEVALPLYVHEQLRTSAMVLGSLWLVYFLFSIAGAAASGLVTSRVRQGKAMGWMVMGWGLSLVPMLWLHSLWVSYAAMALAGFLFAGYPPLARTAVQRLVPAEYHGRVFGVRTSVIALGVPTGSYVGGMAAGWIPPSSAIGWTGAGILLFGILLMSVRAFREIGEQGGE